MQWSDVNPFAPEVAAQHLIRQKFRGVMPETVTAEECVDLMLAFTLYETSRAEALAELMMSWPSRPTTAIS